MLERPKPWIRRSLVEKRTETLNRHHAPPMRCLMCEVRFMPNDAALHRERCPGRPAPHARDIWVQVVPKEKLPARRLEALVKAGAIRVNEDGRFLLRDVELAIDAHRLLTGEGAPRR